MTETQNSTTHPDAAILKRDDLGKLISLLRQQGYQVIAPTLRDQAIVYEEIDSIEDLPAGWTDEQAPGYYRVKKRQDQALFGYAVGPQSWKRFLQVPRQRLWRSEASMEEKLKVLKITQDKPESPRMAFLGIRACELAAISIQDRVLIGKLFQDTHYQARRKDVLFIAVNCGQAGGTCFCTSMGTGPRAKAGYDLALTEIIDDSAQSNPSNNNTHRFIVEAGTPAGRDLLNSLPTEPSSQPDRDRADEIVKRTERSMGRSLDTTNIKELLYANLEHPRWDDVAKRCLSCANCTIVCPTCFCTTTEDTNDLTGQHAERWRRWDSCFTMDHSYIHGGNVHSSVKSRYRQWMTHKLASWIDQFGTSGCVGCGRCITWCPVGIDITEETRAIRENQPQRDNQPAQERK